jgi:hypothetical protein
MLRRCECLQRERVHDRGATVSDIPSGGSRDLTSAPGGREEPEVEDAFDRLVAEGRDRLARPMLPLLTTAFVGGIDVGIGVLIYLVVKQETGTVCSPRWPLRSGSSRSCSRAASCSRRTSSCR